MQNNCKKKKKRFSLLQIKKKYEIPTGNLLSNIFLVTEKRKRLSIENLRKITLKIISESKMNFSKLVCPLLVLVVAIIAHE